MTPKCREGKKKEGMKEQKEGKIINLSIIFLGDVFELERTYLMIRIMGMKDSRKEIRKWVEGT